MTEEEKKELQGEIIRYSKSSLVTFLTMFVTIVYASKDLITVENLDNGILISLFLTAARGAGKVVIETVIFPAMSKFYAFIIKE